MVTANRPGVQTKEKLRVSGMDCGDCAVSIEKSLLQMPGVTRAHVRFGTATADVSYDPEIADREQIVKRISDLGYSIEEAFQAGPLEFLIEGMDCGDCAQTIEKVVESMPGVKSAS